MSLLGKFLGGTAKAGAKAFAFADNKVLGTAIGKTSDVGFRVAEAALVRGTQRTFYNGYTGIKPTKTATGLAWAGAGIYGVASMKGTQMKEPTGTQIEYDGQSPIMTGDGMGGTTNAPTLGASGSLVFGLNAMRRG